MGVPPCEKCSTPATGLPGDEWTCPTCGRHWWADDIDLDDDSVYIIWRIVTGDG